MTDYKNILVIKLGALGDFIQMTGWYTAIRHRWPKAHITLLTNRSFFKLAEQSKCFDKLLEDNRTWNPMDYVRIIWRLITEHYDLIIDLQMQARTQKRYYSLARFFSRRAFVWASPKAGHFLVHYTPTKLPFWWGKKQTQKIDFTPENADLSFCKADKKVLAKLPKKYVLLIPGCSPTHPYKRWPASSYRELAKRLEKEGIAIVVLGTNAEKEEIDTICQNNKKAINFCNKSKLWDIPEIASNALPLLEMIQDLNTWRNLAQFLR